MLSVIRTISKNLEAHGIPLQTFDISVPQIQTDRDGTYSILDIKTGDLLQSGLSREDLTTIVDKEDDRKC